MKLSLKKVEEIAKLARLDLSEEEKKIYAGQLTIILDYVEKLNEINTENIEETSQVTGLRDILREDEAVDCHEEVKKKIIANFPTKKGNLLKVRAVFRKDNHGIE